MHFYFTKYFNFSASYELEGKVHGHNYVLGVTVGALDPSQENWFEEKIQRHLIQKIHSKDFGLDVDFLKGVPISDHRLLAHFSEIIIKEVAPLTLHSLSLERDRRTISRLCLEKGSV